MDWQQWHDEYDQPGSTLARRLRVVQERIRAALDQAPPGPVRTVSLCAGQGRDLLGVLADHPRRGDVRALLVTGERIFTFFGYEELRRARAARSARAAQPVDDLGAG